MRTVELATSSKTYPISIGEGAISLIRPFLEAHISQLTKVFIMTDENIAPLYLDQVRKELSNWDQSVFVAPPGEKAKSLDVYYDAITAALESGIDRHSVVVALGGGAIGDLAGFIAATYMRGIRFIQVPTTILAHDSSVGGKTGINHHLGKNMIGAFHQPDAVFYDLAFLKSLGDAEIRSGFAEVIKHAFIGNKEMYEWLRENITNLGNIEAAMYETILAEGIKVKADIVSKDEKENGIRAYLNFGHTLGHAIEAESGYGKITHGEAVMLGMLFALELSKQEAGLQFDVPDYKAWIEQLGYQTNFPKGLALEGLMDRMKKDKKAVGGSVRFVLLKNIAEPCLANIPDGTLKDMLASHLPAD